MSERRKFDREYSFQGGSVSLGEPFEPAYCVVRDLSDGGALLLVDEPGRMPPEVDLTFARGGAVRRARVMWRGEMGVGVAFVPVIAGGHRLGIVVSLDAVRREKASGTDEQRLAERIARVLRPRQDLSRPPGTRPTFAPPWPGL